MSTNGYKLNRSLSESDLSNTTLDSFALNVFRDQRSPKPQLIQRSVYIEEKIIDSNSQIISRFRSCQDIFGNRSSSCFDLSQMTIGSPNFQNPTDRQPRHSNKIVPMDIDGSQEESYHANNMDIEYIDDHIKQEKYQDFHEVLRRRNMNTTRNLHSALDSGDYGRRNLNMTHYLNSVPNINDYERRHSNMTHNLDRVLDKNNHKSELSNNYERDIGWSSSALGNCDRSSVGLRPNVYAPTPSNFNSTDKLMKTKKTEQKSMLIKLDTASTNTSRINKSLAFLGLVAIAIGCSIYSEDIFLYANHNNHVDNVRTGLIRSVQFQEKAVDTVIRVLETRRNWRSKHKILAFTGPPGVGKTHVANVFKQHFHRKLVKDVLIVHLTYESKRLEVIQGLNSCCLNLIVIDNVKRSDIVDLIVFLQNLPMEYFVLVVSIFNFHDDNDLNYEFDLRHAREVRDAMEDSDLYYDMLVFEHLNDTQVMDWLKREIAVANVDGKFHETVIENVLQGHNSKQHGLKGLGAKLLFELEKLRR